MSRTMAVSLGRAVRGVRWYLKEFTGEAKWDAYVEHCRRHQHEPMSRAEFERGRSDAKEGAVTSRCC